MTENGWFPSGDSRKSSQSKFPCSNALKLKKEVKVCHLIYKIRFRMIQVYN